MRLQSLQHKKSERKTKKNTFFFVCMYIRVCVCMLCHTGSNNIFIYKRIIKRNNNGESNQINIFISLTYMTKQVQGFFGFLLHK